MTSRELFEYALIELNKHQAPSLLLEDYNYFINKAINQYINRVYNLYDINQQKTDDLRVLKSTAILTPALANEYTTSALYSKVYETILPDDYLHMTNCIVEYDVLRNFKCYDSGTKVHFGAYRLTSDMFGQIVNNYNMRPSYKIPYYYINNVNVSNNYPTSDNQVDTHGRDYVIDVTSASVTTSTIINVTIFTGEVKTIVASALDTATLLAADINTAIGTTVATAVNNAIEIPVDLISNITVSGPGLYLYVAPTKASKTRYGNKSEVRMEIRYGKDDATFRLAKVYVDYIKAPQFIRLTQEQVDTVTDTSQQLEFPDYVCQEITNELIKLLMENGSDPRLQTHIPVNQSIANPQQEQPQQKR